MPTYIIIMLCKDDEIYYTDYVNCKFDNLKKAQEEMYKCANNELKELLQVGDYKIINLTREVAIYDDNNELITKYEIIKID